MTLVTEFSRMKKKGGLVPYEDTPAMRCHKKRARKEYSRGMGNDKGRNRKQGLAWLPMET